MELKLFFVPTGFQIGGLQIVKDKVIWNGLTEGYIGGEVKAQTHASIMIFVNIIGNLLQGTDVKSMMNPCFL